MMLWAMYFGLALIAIVATLALLLRREIEQPDRDEGALAILSDQLKEVGLDKTRGLIGTEEARGAEVEIKRHLLNVHRRMSHSTVIKTREASGQIVIFSMALLVPLLAIGIYSSVGAPALPNIIANDRLNQQQREAGITELTDKLLNRLQDDPAGGPSDGWMLLGQTYMRIGQFAQAADAFKTVSMRPEADSAVFSRLAEALIADRNSSISPAAEQAIDRAFALDPLNPAAVYFKALALDQKGQSAAAHDILRGRLKQSDGFEPWMESFVELANGIGPKIGRGLLTPSDFAPVVATGPGPTADDVATASEMSGEDRTAFINSMVERLATRLEEEPQDIDGWLRLGKAYRVLDREKEALAAYHRARGLAEALPSNDPRIIAITQALSELGN